MATTAPKLQCFLAPALTTLSRLYLIEATKVDSRVRELPAPEQHIASIVRLAVIEIDGAILRHQNLPPLLRRLHRLRVGDVRRAVL